MKSGYIKLHRKLFDSKMWLEEPFTIGQAWVDLIAMANYADKDNFYRGTAQRIKRGQIMTSKEHLAKRWKWSEGKVRRFFRSLESMEMVRTDSTIRGTLITIENYAVYQDVRRIGKRIDDGTDGGINDGQTADRRTAKEESKERKESKGGTRKRVSTPTVDDVSLFVSEEGLNVDPDRFWNYYEGLGWKINGRPIENWQAVCRRWDGTEDYGKKKSSGDTDWNEVNRLLDILESGGNIYDQT